LALGVVLLMSALPKGYATERNIVIAYEQAR